MDAQDESIKKTKPDVVAEAKPQEHESLASEPDLNPLTHLKQAWHLFASRWPTYIGITLLSYLIWIPVILIAAGIIAYVYFITSSGRWEHFVVFLIPVAILTAITYVVILLISAWAQLAQLIAVLGVDEKLGAIASYKRALPRLIPFSIFSLLMGTLVVGAYLLFFIPGVLFSLWFSFAAFIFLSNNEKSFPSLLKSKEYIKGYFAEVFVCFFVLGVVVVVISYLPTLIGSLAGENSFLGRLMTMISYPLSFIVGPYALLYKFSIFKELSRVKKDVVIPTKKFPYIMTAILGYILCTVILTLLIVVLAPRVSEMLGKTLNTAKPSTYPSLQDGDDSIFTKQFAQANDVKRRSNVMMLLNGLSQYRAETQGGLPKGITTTPREISSGKGGVNLCSLLVPTYLATLPVDPKIPGDEGVVDCTEAYQTGYMVSYQNDPEGVQGITITVTAPHAELQTISETR